MYCRNCGNKLEDKAVACMKCGLAPLTGKKYCQSCGAETDERAIVCVKCSASLDTIKEDTPEDKLKKFKSIFKEWSVGGKIMFVSSCLALFSMILPWKDVGIASRSGLTQVTILLLGIFIYPLIMLFKKKKIHTAGGIPIVCIGLLFTILFYRSNYVHFGRENITGIGFFVFIIAAITFIVGVFKHENMKFDFKNWNVGEYMILIALCLAVISFFLPWADLVGRYSGKAYSSINAFHVKTNTFFFLVFFLYPFVRLIEGKHIHKMAGLILGGLSLFSAICYASYRFIVLSKVEYFNNITAFFKSGFLLFVISSIGLIVGINKVKKKASTIKGTEGTSPKEEIKDIPDAVEKRLYALSFLIPPLAIYLNYKAKKWDYLRNGSAIVGIFSGILYLYTVSSDFQRIHGQGWSLLFGVSFVICAGGVILWFLARKKESPVHTNNEEKEKEEVRDEGEQ